MASPAHCFLCFEALAANFNNTEPLKLDQVLDLYEKYKKANQPAKDDANSEELDEEDAGNQATESDEDVEDEQESLKTKEHPPQLPSITRLQASTSSSRSSSASTPPSTSANSSTSHLTSSTSNSIATSVSSSRPSYSSRLSVTESYPLFVTWNLISRAGHKSLRGCIGTFEPVPLASGLPSYAHSSAFDDTRFAPIPPSLLSSLSCSLTLLANFEPCDDALDWTLGRHGLRISFTFRNRRHGATYLPDVALEQGWTKAETLESLMRKAGWDAGYSHGVARRFLRGSARNSSDPANRPWEEVADFRAVRYTGLKSSASYQDWRDWRDWVDEQAAKAK